MVEKLKAEAVAELRGQIADKYNFFIPHSEATEILSAVLARNTRPTDEVEKLREALAKCRDTLTHVNVECGYCCCGDPIDAHSIGSGHSPVDADQYAVTQTVDAIDALLTEKANG